MRSEYFGNMYRLVLHEILVQVGLEDQLLKEIPSNYPISSRLNVHLEQFPEWMPGRGTAQPVMPKGVECFVNENGENYVINKLIDSNTPHDVIYTKLRKSNRYILVNFQKHRLYTDFADTAGPMLVVEIGKQTDPHAEPYPLAEGRADDKRFATARYKNDNVNCHVLQ